MRFCLSLLVLGLLPALAFAAILNPSFEYPCNWISGSGCGWEVHDSGSEQQFLATTSWSADGSRSLQALTANHQSEWVSSISQQIDLTGRKSLSYHARIPKIADIGRRGGATTTINFYIDGVLKNSDSCQICTGHPVPPPYGECSFSPEVDVSSYSGTHEIKVEFVFDAGDPLNVHAFLDGFSETMEDETPTPTPPSVEIIEPEEGAQINCCNGNCSFLVEVQNLGNTICSYIINGFLHENVNCLLFSGSFLQAELNSGQNEFIARAQTGEQTASDQADFSATKNCPTPTPSSTPTPTPTPSSTPTPTPSSTPTPTGGGGGTPTPSSTPTPSGSSTPTSSSQASPSGGQGVGGTDGNGNGGGPGCGEDGICNLNCETDVDCGKEGVNYAGFPIAGGIYGDATPTPESGQGEVEQDDFSGGSGAGSPATGFFVLVADVFPWLLVVLLTVIGAYYYYKKTQEDSKK